MATATEERRRTPDRRRRSADKGDGSRTDRRTNDGTPPGANAEDRRFLERYGSKLSKSTHRAKWTHGTDDRPDRNGQTLATRSQDVIRAWAEARDAVPATATRGPDGEPRTLRFDFNASKDDADDGRSRLERIDWEAWFRVFDDRKLVFLYQERRRDGSQSNFFRLDNPTREDG